MAGLQSSAMETSYQVMENALSFWCETKHNTSHCETENTETDADSLCLKWSHKNTVSEITVCT